MDRITYLDTVAAVADYKRELLVALDVGPDHTVLDVGCGPGTDLGQMRGSLVIGVDHDPVMVEEAQRRHPDADVRLGDAHALPVASGSVDRVRVDRVLHQVDDPQRVVAQVGRVLRPGGRAVLAQPDWDTLAVDPGDVETNRVLTRFLGTTMMRHSTIGRQLPRLVTTAGLEVVEVTTSAPVFRDFALADQVLGLSRNADRAVQAGQLDRETADEWVATLRAGPFLATFVVVIAVLRA